MLAEIFMVRLEARARLASEAIAPGNRRFVPFVQANEAAFKERGAFAAGRPADVANDLA
jgi:hypothetical protein